MENQDVKPEDGLFNVGEYYLKNKRFSQAKYVFSRYLTYYPEGKNAVQAAKNLETVETSLVQQGNVKSPAENTAAAPAPAAKAPERKEQSEAAKAYYDAISLVSQEKYQQAYLAFKKIVDANEDPEWAMRSDYEVGRCVFFLKKYDDCIQHYTALLVKYPKHPDLKDALYFIGQCHEKNGKKGQAAAFYKKIVSMSADSGDGTVAKAKRALESLGG
jgi:TolA-binding protein